MSRSVLTPCFCVPFPVPSEPVLFLDREPLRTRLSFKNNIEEATPMTKEAFVTHCIQHHEDFPAVGEIDLAAAQQVFDNLAPSRAIPKMTPQEFMDVWNTLIRDRDVMTID